jgi:hypothetical protein
LRVYGKQYKMAWWWHAYVLDLIGFACFGMKLAYTIASARRTGGETTSGGKGKRWEYPSGNRVETLFFDIVGQQVTGRGKASGPSE